MAMPPGTGTMRMRPQASISPHQRRASRAAGIARRKFLATLGGAAAAWPLAARTQQPMLIVGVVVDAHRGNNDDRSVGAFAVKPRAFGAPLCGIGA